MSRKFFRPFFRPMVATLLLLVSFTACKDTKKATSGPVTAVGQADIGGAYSLIDHTGKPVTDMSFHGKGQLIYFGFATCPDVCPTALQQMGAALELAGPAADYYQPIFITIDPQRDTQQALALYVTANGFPKGLIGLTGSPSQIETVKAAYKVYAKRVADPASAAAYTFDHSSIIYLMDKNGEFVDVFSHNNSPQDIANRLIAHKKTGR